jgi:hypothetical protein
MRTSPWRIAGWSLVVVLLLLPAVAMQFTDEVNWTGSDFVFATVMLVGSGVLLELVVRQSSNRYFRAGVAVAVITALLLVWTTGAVGLIGSEDNPANLLYFAVLAVAVLGALWARFCAAGMTRAMLGAVFVQAVIAVTAFVAELGPPGIDAWRTLFLNGVFVLLWLLAAGLFRRANDGQGNVVANR